MRTLLSLLLLFIPSRGPAVEPPLTWPAQTPPRPSFSALADAIYHAEGGPRARVPYGILSVRVRGHAEARRVCLRTIERAWRDWSQTSHGDFVDYLCDRYCPRGDDPTGNRHLKRNVRWFLKNPKPVFGS